MVLFIRCVSSLLLLAIITPLVCATSPSSANKDLLLLEREARRVAKDGVVMLALGNAGYLDLLLNWKASVDRLNITNYVIVPNDIKAAQQLSFLGVDWAYDPAIGLGDLASSKAASYPSNMQDPMYKLWNGVVHKKAAYVTKIFAMGLDVLVTDVDIVFLKDPLSLFSNKTIDLFFIDDTDLRTARKTPLLCGGFWLGRSNERTLSFVETVRKCEQSGSKEQFCFNAWYRNVTKKGIASSAKVQVMSKDDFPSGYIYFHDFWKTKADMIRVKTKPDPYIVHDNWIVGHENKVIRLQQHGLLMVDTKELEKKMAGFSFNPNITTHEQMVAFHLQQRLPAADRTTPHSETPETPETPNTQPETPDPPAAVCNANADDSSEELPTQFGGSSEILVWGSPALTVCCALLVMWAYLRRKSSPGASTPQPAPPRKPELPL